MNLPTVTLLLQTRCKNTCGENENCVINIDGGIDCRCRPGFGRKNQNHNARCTSKFDHFPNNIIKSFIDRQHNSLNLSSYEKYIFWMIQNFIKNCLIVYQHNISRKFSILIQLIQNKWKKFSLYFEFKVLKDLYLFTMLFLN